MQKMGDKLTYANVTATLALFLVLSGGAAYAASKIQSSDLAHGAVRTSNLFRRAITSGKLAVGAVRTDQLAEGSVGSEQIGAASVAPSNLKFPVSYTASPTGGEAQLTTSPSSYPITGGTWMQKTGEVNIIVGAAMATLASDGHEPCRVLIEISLNGRQIGTSKYSTGSTSTAPEKIEQNLGSLLEIDPTAPTTDKLTASVSSNEGCSPTSRIDSTRFRVLALG
jgi:hypothetical protein